MKRFVVACAVVGLAGLSSVSVASGASGAIARTAPASPGVPTAALAPASPSPRGPAVADRPDPAGSGPAAPAAPGAPLPTGSWQPLGPAPSGPPYLINGGFYGGTSSGRIVSTAVIPSGPHAGRVVIGTAGGGIWTSDNDGSSWLARSDQAPSLAIGAVADDPSTPDHLIAGMGEYTQSGDAYPGYGMLSSTDGGTTWTVQDPGGVFDGSHIAQVAIDPSNPSHMFAASDLGLFVTTNGGTTWAHPTDPSYTNVGTTAVVFDPATPLTVYAAGGASPQIQKSVDGGIHWATANTGLTTPGQYPTWALAIAPSAPATLYLSVGTYNQAVQMFKTINGGSTWAPVTVPDFTGQSYSYGSGSAEQGWYDNVVAVDPTNPLHVVAGGIALVETTNGGTSWTNVNGGGFFAGPPNKIHPDQHGLAFRPDGRVWVGDDGGAFLYSPATSAVVNANGNLNITQHYFGFNEVGGTILAGSQDNATSRTSSSSVGPWTGIFSGDGGPSAITPNNPNLQFLEANQSLYRTDDAFASNFVNITPPTGALFTPPMTIAATADPNNPVVFYGGSDLWRTLNPSAASPTWTKVTTTGAAVTAIAVDTANTQIVYVGFQTGVIQVSTDGGATFTSIATHPFTQNFVTGISVDPTNPKAITATLNSNDTRYYAGSPHVGQYSYSTTPASGTWTVINGNLPNRGVGRVVYDNGNLIAGTDAGVYGTTAPAGSGTVWSLVGSNLPAVQVQDLFVDPSSQALYVVTHGRGAWVLPAAAPAATVAGSPSPVGTGKPLTITWSGIASPTATDWVGLYSTHAAADSAFVGWRYTTGAASGTVNFTVPANAPSGAAYELRLFSNNTYTRLATSSPLTVQAAGIAASPNPVGTGKQLTATWSNVLGPTANDWVGLYASSAAADGAFLAWRYTGATASGAVNFTVPATAATASTYQLRLFTNNTYNRMATSAAFTVQAATVTESPSPIGTGGQMTVNWANVLAPTANDWVGLYTSPAASDGAFVAWRYTANAASGSVPFIVPATAPTGSTYQLRLFTNNTFNRMATFGPISIQKATIAESPNPVTHNTQLNAAWTNMLNPTSADWVGLYPSSAAADNAFIAWTYTGNTTSGNVNLLVPNSATAHSGYELRLYRNNTFNRAATSSPFAVN